MLPLPHWPWFIEQDVLNRRLLFKNKPAAVAPKKPSPIISSASGIAEETVDAAKICGGAENVVKTETQQTFVNGLLGFITFRYLYSAGSARVLLGHWPDELPIDMGNSICTAH